MARGRSKDSKRALVFIVMLLIAGVAGTIVIWQVFTGYDRQITEAKRPEATSKIVIAARDLYQGVKITEDDIALIKMPAKYIADGGFSSAESVVGRIPRERILSNEFVREERLANPEDGVGLNALVPHGQRAISVNVHGGDAVSGFINPDNIVDILVTISGDDRGSDTETHTVLQAVPVLGVDRMLKGDQADESSVKSNRRQKPSVTFAVTPEQAEQVAHAEKQGKITLSLRNDLDRRMKELGGVGTEELMGIQPVYDPVVQRTVAIKQKEPEKVENKTNEVQVETTSTLQIIRGTKAVEERFEE